MITVDDILNVMPPGTQVVAGRQSLNREVTWATRPKPSPPALAHVRGGEIVLLSGTALQALDERMTLDGAVRQLAALDVASIAFVGRITNPARLAAEESGIVLIQLPGDADLGSLEREATHVITERRRDAQRHGFEAGRRLMELAIAGESISTVIRALGDEAKRPVALEGRDGRVLAYHVAGTHQLERATVEELFGRTRDELGSWLRQAIAGSPAEPPVGVFALNETLRRVVAPVIGRDGPLGAISVIVPEPRVSEETELLASRGAAASAVVMAREYATLAARREIELNVLDEVLDGALRSEVTLLQQAKRLGHDLQANHVVLVTRLESAGNTAIARGREHRWPVFDEVMARRGPRLLWRIRGNNTEILWPVENDAEAKSVATTLFEDLQRRLERGDAVVSLGVGRVSSGLEGIQRSHQEAKHALSMARRLNSGGGVTRFADLGVYRLIFAAEHLPELRAFHDEALQTVIDYDRQHSADLVRTLKAFFDAKCGPKEAAGLLEVHRNTVLYRLERIEEITGLDLDDADVRLRLHLAVCIHTALFQG